MTDVSEQQVADSLGSISRPALRKWRKDLLTEGTDWYRGDNEMVIYRQSGVEKVVKALAALNGKKNEPAAQALDDVETPFDSIGVVKADHGGAEKRDPVEPVKKQAGVAACVVHRWQFSNRQLIEGRRVDDGKIIRIRVHDASKYRAIGKDGKPMQVFCALDPMRDDIGTVCSEDGGRTRGPRYVGAW